MHIGDIDDMETTEKLTPNTAHLSSSVSGSELVNVGR